MIETLILEYLTSSLAVPVVLEEPENAPMSFVLMEKTGGSKSNHLCASTVAFQSYAGSLYQAAELNDRVKQAAEGLNTLIEIVSVRLNSDYNFTDTTTKRYRYQAVYDIKHY